MLGHPARDPYFVELHFVELKLNPYKVMALKLVRMLHFNQPDKWLSPLRLVLTQLYTEPGWDMPLQDISLSGGARAIKGCHGL